jgi:hypothetical protein
VTYKLFPRRGSLGSESIDARRESPISGPSSTTPVRREGIGVRLTR